MRCNIFYDRFQREETRLEEIQSTVKKNFQIVNWNFLMQFSLLEVVFEFCTTSKSFVDGQLQL